jgi:glycosyltransferase involved in cell wall biosynthesis
MNIVYISRMCSTNKFNKIYNQSKIKLEQQAQKYHRLMVEGFVKKEEVKVTVLTGLPVTSANTSQKLFKGETEVVDNVTFKYLSLFNVMIIKHIMIFWGCFFNTLKLCLKDEDTVVICDVLNISISSGALLAAKITGRKNIGIVTDVPKFFEQNSKENKRELKRVIEKSITVINTYIMNSFASYVFLTQQMDTLINKKNRPYVVIEGQVDINMNSVPNIIENKYEKKVCIYAGALQKKYGIENLTKAFIKAVIKNAELHLYGNGDYEEELNNICREHSNIKYFGVMPNDYVVKEQLKASLLINPRPTNEEYTKYSFPSKNMEYMVSGTPVLTTMLPGMPVEYYPYVYLIDNETIEGLTNSLRYVLSKPKEELHDFGCKSKEFVLIVKNNVIQARRILEMVKD